MTTTIGNWEDLMGPNFDGRKPGEEHRPNPLAQLEAERVRGEQLSRHFPELATRLARAMAQVQVDPANRGNAMLHVLCAEALAEVLEGRARDGRGNQGDQQGRIISEYGRLVVDKVLNFEQRPTYERHKINEIYAVDIDLVGHAIRMGHAQYEHVASVLEDPGEYAALLRTLDR